MAPTFKDLFEESGFFSNFALDLIKGESTAPKKISSEVRLEQLKEAITDEEVCVSTQISPVESITEVKRLPLTNISEGFEEEDLAA